MDSMKQEQIGLWTVQSQDIDAHWFHVEHLMESIKKWSDGKYHAEDIKKKLKEADMQLWIAGDYQAIGVTEISLYPQQKVCTVIFMAGSSMVNWLPLHEHVVEWARDIGCDVIQENGRKGWAKLFDWDQIHVVLRKKL